MRKDDSAVPSPPLPRGVADPAAGVGYVSEPAGTVAAFVLADGSSQWRAHAAGTPVAAGEGRVFLVAPGGGGAPGVLRLQALDAGTGEVVGGHEVELELDVAVPRLSPADLDLSARATAGGLELGWRHRGGYRGGAPPSREVEERFSRQQLGALRYSPEDGTVERLPAGQPPPPLASFPYRQLGRWREEAWLIAGALARLKLGGGEERELRLESWSPAVTGEVVGEPMRDEVVWRGEDVEPSVSGAGSHLFLRRTRPPGQRWHVVAVPGGERAGEVPFAEGDQWPEMLEGRVYHLAAAAGGDLVLRAVELASGRRLWERSLASAPEGGPSPPPPPG